jgi:hypothetical protein
VFHQHIDRVTDSFNKDYILFYDALLEAAAEAYVATDGEQTFEAFVEWLLTPSETNEAFNFWSAHIYDLGFRYRFYSHCRQNNLGRQRSGPRGALGVCDRDAHRRVDVQPVEQVVCASAADKLCRPAVRQDSAQARGAQRGSAKVDLMSG